MGMYEDFGHNIYPCFLVKLFFLIIPKFPYIQICNVANPNGRRNTPAFCVFEAQEHPENVLPALHRFFPQITAIQNSLKWRYFKFYINDLSTRIN